MANHKTIRVKASKDQSLSRDTTLSLLCCYTIQRKYLAVPAPILALCLERTRCTFYFFSWALSASSSYGSCILSLRHPLRSVPGPFVTRLTRFWYFLQVRGGNSSMKILPCTASTGGSCASHQTITA